MHVLWGLRESGESEAEGKVMDQKMVPTVRTLLREEEGEKAGLGPGLRRG